LSEGDALRLLPSGQRFFEKAPPSPVFWTGFYSHPGLSPDNVADRRCLLIRFRLVVVEDSINMWRSPRFPVLPRFFIMVLAAPLIATLYTQEARQVLALLDLLRKFQSF